MGDFPYNLTLAGARILLGGPIKAHFVAGTFDAEARSQHEALLGQLRAAGAAVYSAPETEQYAIVKSESQDVARRDFTWCRASDVYVALWPTRGDGLPVQSQGTAIELGWASMLRCPVLLLWDSKNATNYSHLVRGLGVIAPTRFLDHRAPISEIINVVRELYQYSKQGGEIQ